MPRLQWTWPYQESILLQMVKMICVIMFLCMLCVALIQIDATLFNNSAVFLQLLVESTKHV